MNATFFTTFELRLGPRRLDSIGWALKGLIGRKLLSCQAEALESSLTFSHFVPKGPFETRP